MESGRIDAHLARRLVDTQFPQWSALPLHSVRRQGIDNRTFRLGAELSVRLPAGERYALQVAKEQRWLPELRPLLPLPIPEPVAEGQPAFEYPYSWSIYRWIDGVPASEAITDWRNSAGVLAAFLGALHRVDPTDGPEPGPHNFFRGAPLSV
jgi:aminoglycoside phosphotransferase (APT) family kinase protein